MIQERQARGDMDGWHLESQDRRSDSITAEPGALSSASHHSSGVARERLRDSSLSVGRPRCSELASKPLAGHDAAAAFAALCVLAVRRASAPPAVAQARRRPAGTRRSSPPPTSPPSIRAAARRSPTTRWRWPWWTARAPSSACIARPRRRRRARPTSPSRSRAPPAYFSNDQAPLSVAHRALHQRHPLPARHREPAERGPLRRREHQPRLRPRRRGDAIFNTPIDRRAPSRARSARRARRPSLQPGRHARLRGRRLRSAARTGSPSTRSGSRPARRDLRDSHERLARRRSTPAASALPRRQAHRRRRRGRRLARPRGVRRPRRRRRQRRAASRPPSTSRARCPRRARSSSTACRLPFAEAAADRAARRGSSPGTFRAGHDDRRRRARTPGAEGYLIGPRGSAAPGGLTLRRSADASSTRRWRQAQRHARRRCGCPSARRASFIIAVDGPAGRDPGRVPDARTRSSTRSTSSRRRRATPTTSARAKATRCCAATCEAAPYDDLPLGARAARRTAAGPSRAGRLGFGGQPLFPPGIDARAAGRRPAPGSTSSSTTPLNPCTEGPGPSRGGNRAFLNQNGITWFPGQRAALQERPARRRHRRQRRRRRPGRPHRRRRARRASSRRPSCACDQLDPHRGGESRLPYLEVPAQPGAALRSRMRRLLRALALAPPRARRAPRAPTTCSS